MSFCHLHTHDEYSQLDGLGKAEDYAKEAARLEFEYLGTTNHGNVDGCIKFQKACNGVGVKPVLGCEFYIVNDLSVKEKGERRYHLCAFAYNKQGWRNILKMLTVANLEGFYRKPRIDPSCLIAYGDGLKITTACSSSFIIAEPWGEELFAYLLAKFGHENVFLEIMPYMLPEQMAVNKLALKFAKRYKANLIASNDCHYPTRGGARTQEVLLAIQSRAKWNDQSRWRFDIDDLYLKSTQAMTRAFQKQGVVPQRLIEAALENTVVIAEGCSKFNIEKIPVNLPLLKEYQDVDETAMLNGLCQQGLRKRIISTKTNAKSISVYRNRMDEELDLICELGYQRYFLIVWELIDWCKKNNIMTGPGRGSVGGCLVAYLLYITDVDPIKYNLLFSRFISPARIDLPDIDMDFEDSKRELVRQHLEEQYGTDNVAGVSTFLKMKGRAAVRDVSRVFDLPAGDVDAAAKSIVVRSGGDFRADFTIEDAFQTFEDGIKFAKKYPEATKIAMDLEGQVRGSGMHAAAICISNSNLKEGTQCNLCTRRGGATVVNWDKNDAEYMGLMKLDILGLSALTILSQTRKMVKANHGVDIDFNALPLDDEEVYKEISMGHTVGAFQIGSMGLSSYCKELVVEDFEMLVNATSLWRPGTLRTGMVTEFVDRKRGKSYSSIHPIIADLTKDTLGIIIYQEQVMRFMYELAGLPWKTCDTVRKVISKSQGEELFLKFKDQFVKGCKKLKTLDEETAGKVWEELASFGSYSFNLSHAVEYSMISYWDMYCKVHFPAEFMACSLSYGGGDKKEEYITEARRLGLKILLPKAEYSSATTWETSPSGKELYAPFIEIKGIGDKTAQKLAELKTKHNDGFWVTKSGQPTKTKKLIDRLQKYNEGDEDEFDGIQELFQFDISSDPLRSIKGIYELVKNKITTIEGIDFNKPSDENQLLFCTMPEVKFGYRQKVLKARQKKTEDIHDTAGMADNLGGVYGFVKDQSPAANAMLVFNSELYSRRKNKVEHCGEKWLLIEANHPRKGMNNLFCNRMATEEDLKKCEFDGISVKLIKRPVEHFSRRELLQCDECPLRSEAKVPVPPSRGRTNIMVIGEAPGKDEDKGNKAFIGRAGEVLWQELEKHGFTRSYFNITNVVKCFPSVTKTPSAKQMGVCSSRWLDQELDIIKPVLVLALGNAPLYYFKQRESGISSLSGTTEWIKKKGLWVCWCLHPASTLYQQENKGAFNKGIENFVRALNNLSYRR